MTVALAASFVFMLIWRACGRRAGFATWHMFVGVSQALMNLKYIDDDGVEQELNPWDYLPHSMTAMDETTLRAFLLYLERIVGLKTFGTVELREDLTRRTLRVEDGRVVD